MSNSASLVQSQVSDAEWELRVNLAACYRLVAHYHWDDLILRAWLGSSLFDQSIWHDV
jgi:hypothetical protein